MTGHDAGITGHVRPEYPVWNPVAVCSFLFGN
jgi:hypothetical protein